jgi:hypothetical protein
LKRAQALPSIVCEILGGADVTRDAHEAGDQARRFDAPHGVDWRGRRVLD